MLSRSRLPWMNLRGYPVRTGTLVLFSMLMTMTIFGGTLIVQGIEHGLRTVQSRLGADIMVTPAEADTDFDAQTFLVSAELFLATARASCCSGRYQVIAYDPATDFTIQPWMRDAVGRTQLGDDEVIVGANVLANDPNNFQLFDNTLRVVGQFDATGSTLDNAVYMNFETAKKVIDSSLRKGLNKYSTLETDRIISSVMVKVAPGYDAEAVGAQIHQQVPGVAVATSARMVSGIAQSLDSTSRTVAVLIGVAWGVGLLMITLLFVLMVAERKREFATLVAMGAHRRMISGIIIREALGVNILGGVGGIIISGVLLVSFSGLVDQSLGGGFLVPSALTLALLALGALASVGIVALVSSWIALRYVTTMDASLALKEGE